MRRRLLFFFEGRGERFIKLPVVSVAGGEFGEGKGNIMGEDRIVRGECSELVDAVVEASCGVTPQVPPQVRGLFGRVAIIETCLIPLNQR